MSRRSCAEFYLLPIPDPGVKKAPDPGSATLLVCREKKQKALMRNPGPESRFRILTFYPSRIPDPDPEHCLCAGRRSRRGWCGIPDPDPDFLPIPDPGSRIQGSKRRRIPDLQYCLFVQGEEAEGGDAGSRIRILTFYPSGIPDLGAKKAPDPGSATL